VDRLLIVEPLGGLANRLRVVASASLTAPAAGRRIELRWRRDRACGASWDELFAPRFTSCDGEHPAEAHIYDRELSNFARPGSGDVVEDPAAVVLVRTCFQFRPSTMSIDEFVAGKAAFYRGLIPVPVVQQRLDELAARLAGAPTVGVHVRRSDLVLAGTPPERISPTSRFIARMRELLAAEPKTRFFLATDDRQEEARIATAFPGRVLTQPERELARSDATAMQHALVDWLALARSGRILRSAGTSFSREAAIAGGVPRETIRRRLWPYDRPRFWIEAWHRRMSGWRRRAGLDRAYR